MNGIFNKLRNGVKNRIFGRVLLPFAIRKVNSYDSSEIEDAINFTYNDVYGLIKPFQNKKEIYKLLKILEEKEISKLLEIGTAYGGSLFLLSRITQSDGTIISIDLPAQFPKGGYPKWREKLYHSFSSNSQELNLLRRNSHSIETLNEVREMFKGEPIDFLFIDGDHSYEGVKKDFNMYKELVKEKGLIAFHDIQPGPKEDVGGVPQLWEEIKQNFDNHTELINDKNQKGLGIGLLEV